MKTKYFLFSNGDYTTYGSSENLKGIIDRYYYELNYKKKSYGDYSYNDFGIGKFTYNQLLFDIDYAMDGYLYVYDKIHDELIDCDQLEKYGIYYKEIKKDFLYHKNRKHG